MRAFATTSQSTTPHERAVAIERVAGGFRLSSELRLDMGIDDVFAFFSDPHNLALITPDWLRPQVTTGHSIDMAEGARIDYRFRVRGVPAVWRSEITAFEPPYRFVDEQRFGPFLRWRHEHTFEPSGSGTIALDDIDYRVPGGRVIHGLFVERELRRLFEHRHRRLTEILVPAGA